MLSALAHLATMLHAVTTDRAHPAMENLILRQQLAVLKRNGAVSTDIRAVSTNIPHESRRELVARSNSSELGAPMGVEWRRGRRPSCSTRRRAGRETPTRGESSVNRRLRWETSVRTPRRARSRPEPEAPTERRRRTRRAPVRSTRRRRARRSPRGRWSGPRGSAPPSRRGARWRRWGRSPVDVSPKPHVRPGLRRDSQRPSMNAGRRASPSSPRPTRFLGFLGGRPSLGASPGV